MEGGGAMAATYREEAARLQALHDLRVLDSPPSEAIDRITRMAAWSFAAPVALVTLVDAQRQRFKSRFGVTVDEIPREHSFCTHAITSDEVMVVPDASRDPRFATNPLVVGEPEIRFYAGAPLILRDKIRLGTLCVVDRVPRPFTADDRRMLADLAALVVVELEKQAADMREADAAARPHRYEFEAFVECEARARLGEAAVAVIADMGTPGQLRSLFAELGPAWSEAVALHASQTISESLGARVSLHRVGYLCFGFLLDDGEETPTRALLAALAERLREPFECEGIPFLLSPAIGAVSLRLGEDAAANVLRRAFAAAQEARARHATVAWHGAGMRWSEGEARGLVLLRELRRALQKGEGLSLDLQPRIDLATGQCVAAEMLLRWRHARLGSIPPGDFIALAERTALARPLTDWVINAALAASARLAAAGLALRLSINVSAVNLDEPDLIDRLAAALRRYGVPPERMELEFTESALADNAPQALARIEQARALGVTIAIDDFGTGYSNLTYLQRIPAGILKIDQSFVRSLPSSSRDRVLVRTMIGMAHELGYRVVVEGVENDEIRSLAAAWGADEAQGYGIARPMSQAAFETWLRRARHGAVTPAEAPPLRAAAAVAE